MNGKPLAEVQFENLIPASANLHRVLISEDLAQLFLLYSDSKLQVVSLNSYFKHFPQDVKSKAYMLEKRHGSQGILRGSQRSQQRSPVDHWAVRCGAFTEDEIVTQETEKITQLKQRKGW